MLDVLIIGSGPHALTLASLLSNPNLNSDHDHDLPCPSSCSDPKKSGRSNSKHQRSKNQMTEEPLTKLTISEKIPGHPLRILVVDSYGEWAILWKKQFNALNIPHLRSHSLVHTDPLNKNALQEFVIKNERSAELQRLPDQVYILDKNAFFNDMRLGKKEQKRLNVTSTLKSSLSFSLPGTQLSVDFFKEQVDKYGLDKVLVKGTVEGITPIIEYQTKTEKVEERLGKVQKDGEQLKKRVKYFQVHLQDGEVLKARQVVMATGPTRMQMANVPAWVKNIGESYPEERLQHTVYLMHQTANYEQNHQVNKCTKREKSLPPQGLHLVCEARQKVLVVGGGLTSAHVISIALQQGASHVTWVMRKHLQLKQFDVGDVESLVGRYSHVEQGIKMDGQAYLRQFYNERSLHKRLAMIHQARKGGAVTPEAYIQLQPFILNGQLEVKTHCQVKEASWCYKNQMWNLSLTTGEQWIGDMIWLATGCKLDVKQDPLLSEVMKEFPIQVLDGWPCISETLQWTDGCQLYLMGQYAALQIGPHAVNLAGGQAASMRIAKDIITSSSLQNDGQPSSRSEKRTKTEEYVQQMYGLLWL